MKTVIYKFLPAIAVAAIIVSNQSSLAQTTEQKDALGKAKQYLEYSAFSHDGLVRQLVHEKFDREDAVFAGDNVGADWNEQAVRKAKQYLEYSGFSRDGLIKPLKHEGFTSEQALHGVERGRI